LGPQCLVRDCSAVALTWVTGESSHYHITIARIIAMTQTFERQR
jgi:hypothetical protein